VHHLPAHVTDEAEVFLRLAVPNRSRRETSGPSHGARHGHSAAQNSDPVRV